jgi:hypothetical protein
MTVLEARGVETAVVPSHDSPYSPSQAGTLTLSETGGWGTGLVSYVGGAVVAGVELLVKGAAEENEEGVSMGAEETTVVPSQDGCPYPPQATEGVSVAGGLEISIDEVEGTSGTDVAGVSVAGGVGAEASGVEEEGTS